MAVEVGATRLLAQVVSEKAIGLWGPGNEDKVFQSLSESFRVFQSLSVIWL